MSRQSSSPSISGISQSEISRPPPPLLIRRQASAPLETTSTAWPVFSRALRSFRAEARSSSATRIFMGTRGSLHGGTEGGDGECRQLRRQGADEALQLAQDGTGL